MRRLAFRFTPEPGAVVLRIHRAACLDAREVARKLLGVFFIVSANKNGTVVVFFLLSVLFVEFSLRCLSRACLDKMISFIAYNKWTKSTVVPPRFLVSLTVRLSQQMPPAG
jgi:hypothetical protein